jgi:hypothetical protein
MCNLCTLLYLNDSNTACELRYPLIELLLLIFLFCRLKIRVMKVILKVSYLVLFL